MVESPGQPLNALHINDQQPVDWQDLSIYNQNDAIDDFITQNTTASHLAPIHEFGDLSFDNMDTDMNSTTIDDNQLNLESLFHDLRQELSLPRQTSFPRRRSRYRFRREGQQTRACLIPASEASSDPLQRWRDSPPDEEAAPIAAILSALGDPDNQLSHPADMASGRAPDARSRKSRSVAGSNTSTLSSGTSHKSGRSDRSTNSINRGTNVQARGRRRGRVEKTGVEKPRIFACTFCCDSFRSKYDWARHEKSLHLNLETWTCAPRDGFVLSATGEQRCAYCDFPDPTPQHLDEHNHNACAGTSRVFARKDHLVQHLRVLHRLKELPPLDTWRQETTCFTCRCGFCNHRLNSWKERVDHLAGHFRKGFTMRDWQGEHEFPPSIAALEPNNRRQPQLDG